MTDVTTQLHCTGRKGKSESAAVIPELRHRAHGKDPQHPTPQFTTSGPTAPLAQQCLCKMAFSLHTRICGHLHTMQEAGGETDTQTTPSKG